MVILQCCKLDVVESPADDSIHPLLKQKARRAFIAPAGLPNF